MSPKEILRVAGLRPTMQRTALFAHLANHPQPQSISALSVQLKSQMDTVTVYRIMESFMSAGLARQVDLRQGAPLFELVGEHDHHHIVCTRCDHIEDFEGCNYQSLTKSALAQSTAFASIQSHAIELFGLCNKCIH